jgi:hypothetical protein
LIHDIGLLTKHGLGYFIDIFRAWERQQQQEKQVDTSKLGTLPMTWPELQKKLEEINFTRLPIPIKVCAVWDTVGSLGVPLGQSWLSKLGTGFNIIDGVPSPYSFVNTKVCDNIERAFHAIALDEHRVHFQPTIWEQPLGQKYPLTLKQCWFSGVHGHIGGGSTDNNVLPNLALAWMMTQLRPYLDIDYKVIKINPKDEELAASLHLKGETNPDSGNLCLTLSDFSPTDRLAGKIRDSKVGIFVLDGVGTEGVRHPTQNVRTDPKTMQPYDPAQYLENTHETIHCSVRRRFWGNDFLLANGQKYYSEALKHWNPVEGAKPQWEFKQPHVNEKKLAPVEEETMTDYELEIYRYWFDGFRDIEEFDLKNTTH